MCERDSNCSVCVSMCVRNPCVSETEAIKDVCERERERKTSDVCDTKVSRRETVNHGLSPQGLQI